MSVLLVNGLALGGLTSIFSIIHTVLLRPAPYPHAQELVLFEHGRRSRLVAWSAPFYREIERNIQAFDAIGVFRNVGIALTTGEETNQLRSSITSSGLFRVLGVNPLHGRTFAESDDGPGQSESVVISESLWDRLYARSSEAVGSRLILDGRPRTVVGVMPAEFAFPDAGVQVWLPLGELGRTLEIPQAKVLHPVARLKSRIHRDAAHEEVASVIQQLNQRHIERASHRTDFVLRSLERQLYAETIGGVGFRPQTMRNVASSLYLLSIAALLTMAGAGLYVTSLGLIRSERRILPVGIQLALGSPRFRVVLEGLSEGLLISVGVALLGLAVAMGSNGFLLAMAPSQIPRIEGLAIDPHVFLICWLASLATTLFASLIPALRAVRTGSSAGVRLGVAPQTGSTALQQAFLTGQLAFSVLLLIGSGLLIKTTLDSITLHVSTDPSKLVALKLTLPRENQLAFTRKLERRLRSLPGAEAAGSVFYLPHELHPDSGAKFITLETDGGYATYLVPLISATESLAETLGMPLLAGRWFEITDHEQAARVAVVDSEAARRLWPGESPLGKKFKLGWEEDDVPWATVVGVAGTIRQRHVRRDDRLRIERAAEIYVPFSQRPTIRSWFVIRTAGDGSTLMDAARREIQRLAPGRAVIEAGSLRALIDRATAPQRFYTWLLVAFAVLTSFLAILSTYGITRYAVGLRSVEIAIRGALGATPQAILNLVIVHGMKFTLTGILLGTIGALGFGHMMASVFFDVVHVPILYLVIPLGLALAAALACWSAARKPSLSDPAEVLRTM